MGKIKAIIFDMDDTLYDYSNKLWESVVKKTIKTMIDNGLQMEFDKAFSFAVSTRDTISTKELLRKLVEGSGSKDEKLVQLGITKYYNWGLDKDLDKFVKPFPDVPATLEALKKRYKLILITFGAKEAQLRKVELLSIKNFFDLILVSDISGDADKTKCFVEALRRFNLKPEEVVSVGDRIRDEIKVSNMLGIKTVRILQGRNKREVPKDRMTTPNFRINKISDLPSLLYALDDSSAENIFRAYDIRGVFGVNMNVELVENLGKAIGKFFGEGKTIAVGRDARTTGEVVEKALIKGLVSMGCNVLKLGVVPTQVTYFSVPSLNLGGGVMITASHNPPDWNGFKLLKAGGKFIFGDELVKIKEMTLSKSSDRVEKEGTVSEYNKILEDYLEYAVKKVSLKRKLKIVLDTGNGVAGKIARRVFEKAGCDILMLNEDLDGNFTSRPSEPSEFSLEELSKKVVEEGADFGAGFDGDGDRAMFVDDKGRVISSGSLIIMLFSNYLLEKQKGEKIIYEICTSSTVGPFVEERGGAPLVTKVGHVFIKDAMLKENAIFAGEYSSHFYFRDMFNFDDGIFAGLKMAELLSASETKFSEMIDSLPKLFYRSDWIFDVPDRIKFQIIEKMKEDFKRSDMKFSDLDGIKVFFDDGWVVWRASNTQPQIKVYLEANTEKRFDELTRFAETKIKEGLETIK